MLPRVSRSLLLTAPRRPEWMEEALPSLQAHDVLVQTQAGAISIGSELPHYLGTARHSVPETYPQMTGYESLGTVIARGPEVHHLRPGDRVVGFYGHRTHAVVRAERVIAVPPEICDKLALLAILSCDVAKGVRKVQPWIGEPVLVTGAGAIGLLAVWLLRALGATAVDVVEPRAERRVLAQRLGARRVYTPHEGDTLDETYAVGLECSSRNAAFALLQAHLRPNGRVCILADGNVEPLVLAPAFHEKELSVVGSSDGWDYHAHAAWYFAIVRQERGALEEIFDRRIVADELMAMFERLATSEETATKVFVWYASPRQSLG